MRKYRGLLGREIAKTCQTGNAVKLPFTHDLAGCLPELVEHRRLKPSCGVDFGYFDALDKVSATIAQTASVNTGLSQCHPKLRFSVAHASGKRKAVMNPRTPKKPPTPKGPLVKFGVLRVLVAFSFNRAKKNSEMLP